MCFFWTEETPIVGPCEPPLQILLLPVDQIRAVRSAQHHDALLLLKFHLNWATAMFRELVFTQHSYYCYYTGYITLVFTWSAYCWHSIFCFLCFVIHEGLLYSSMTSDGSAVITL